MWCCLILLEGQLGFALTEFVGLPLGLQGPQPPLPILSGPVAQCFLPFRIFSSFQLCLWKDFGIKQRLMNDRWFFNSINLVPHPTWQRGRGGGAWALPGWELGSPAGTGHRRGVVVSSVGRVEGARMCGLLLESTESWNGLCWKG